jgi:hypothetical protein
MTWQDQISLDLCGAPTSTGASTASHMQPGLTGQYNRELREKASQRNPPVPPEFMGIEGEYDPCGLARRLAHALDQDDQLAQIETLTLAQQGNALALTGTISNQQALEKIVKIARHLDGAHEVDVSQVCIHSSSKSP